MIVLGIDPGTRHLGWGIVRRDGTRPAHVAHGVIDTDVSASIAIRLCQIEEELVAVIAAYAPTASVVETMFFSKDATSAAKLGHARGVALLVLARAGLPIAELEPTKVKRTIVGHGRADKHQVAVMIATILRLPAPPRSDAADALAIALAHAQAAGFQAQLAGARSSRPPGPASLAGTRAPASKPAGAPQRYPVLGAPRPGKGSVAQALRAAQGPVAQALRGAKGPVAQALRAAQRPVAQALAPTVRPSAAPGEDGTNASSRSVHVPPGRLV